MMPQAGAAPSSHAPLADWLDYLGRIHVTSIDLGLERLRPVAEALGLLHPQATVVTVAGTNGKGSTTMAVAQIYQAAGYRVGLYQSPHVHRFNERVRMQGVEASDPVLVEALVQVEQARQGCGLSLSFFESTTLAAWLIFQQQGCEVWVLEVGLGGRLDAVNLIDPDVAVITNIGLDHTDWLGDTLEQIGSEKAGIMRPGIPVVYGDPGHCPDSVRQQAARLGVRWIQAGQHYQSRIEGGSLVFGNAALTLALPQPQLAAVNVAAAVAAVLAGPLPVSLQALHQGVAQARLPGRLQAVEIRGRRVVLDVAHNAHGMAFLLAQLQSRGWLEGGQRVDMVFSMLADKDIAAVVQTCRAWVQDWYVAELHTPRAAPLIQLLAALEAEQEQGRVHVSADLPAALQQALQHSPPERLMVVCGSFHVIEALPAGLTA